MPSHSFKHNYIGTEHILRGSPARWRRVAARPRVARHHGRAVRAQVVRIVGSGEWSPPANPSTGPRAKKVLELALREAAEPGHTTSGRAILLGLGRENEGVLPRASCSTSTADRRRVLQRGHPPCFPVRRPPPCQGSAPAQAPARQDPLKLLDISVATSPSSPPSPELYPFVGRENEIERIMRSSRAALNTNPVLIGRAQASAIPPCWRPPPAHQERQCRSCSRNTQIYTLDLAAPRRRPPRTAAI